MSFGIEAKQDRTLAERFGVEARLNPPETKADLQAVNTDGLDTLQVIDVMAEYEGGLDERDIADKTGIPLDVVKEKLYELEHSDVLENLV